MACRQSEVDGGFLLFFSCLYAPFICCFSGKHMRSTMGGDRGRAPYPAAQRPDKARFAGGDCPHRGAEQGCA